MVEEKRSDRRQSGSFLLAGNVGLCSIQRSLGCSHADMSTEFGHEKTCFSPSAASAGQGFPSLRIWSGTSRLSLVPQPRLAHLPMDAPGSIILEDLESVSTTLFCCSCMDYSFRLLLLSCPCVDLDKHSVFCRFTGTVCTRGTDTFSVLAHSFSPFVSHFDTHFLHLGDSPGPCSAGVHRAAVHICMQRLRSQSS